LLLSNQIMLLITGIMNLEEQRVMLIAVLYNASYTIVMFAFLRSHFTKTQKKILFMEFTMLKNFKPKLIGYMVYLILLEVLQTTMEPIITMILFIVTFSRNESDVNLKAIFISFFVYIQLFTIANSYNDASMIFLREFFRMNTNLARQFKVFTQGQGLALLINCVLGGIVYWLSDFVHSFVFRSDNELVVKADSFNKGLIGLAAITGVVNSFVPYVSTKLQGKQIWIYWAFLFAYLVSVIIIIIFESAYDHSLMHFGFQIL